MEKFNGTVTLPRTQHPGFPEWAKKIDADVLVLIASPEEWRSYERDISSEHTFYVYSDKIKIGDGLGYICSLPFADIFWTDNANIHQNILEEMFTLSGTKAAVKKENLVLKFN